MAEMIAAKAVAGENGEPVEQALCRAYEEERVRLKRLACGGAPQGVYDTPVFGAGPARPWLMLIGEAPGAQEVQAGRPFVGKAGQQLNTLLAQAGVDREDVYITNAVKYRPVTVSARSVRNRTPSTPEIKAASWLLLEEIMLLFPACIATLGNVPLNAVLALGGGRKLTVGEAHGQAMTVCIAGKDIRLFPLYHPASTIYNRALLPVCEQDAQNLGKLYAMRYGCEQSVKTGALSAHLHSGMLY